MIEKILKIDFSVVYAMKQLSLNTYFMKCSERNILQKYSRIKKRNTEPKC